MMYFNYAQLVFSSLVSALPLLLVWLAGAGLSIARWRRNPRVYKLALIGFSALIIQVLFQTAWVALSTFLHLEAGITTQFTFAADLAVNLIFIAFRLAGFLMVILAAFQGREGVPTQIAPVSQEVSS
jgi:uncharacterized membrane protein YjjP (DUF1212 family)